MLLRLQGLTSQLVKLGSEVSGANRTLRMGNFFRESQGALHSAQRGIWETEGPQRSPCQTVAEHFAIMTDVQCVRVASVFRIKIRGSIKVLKRLDAVA